MPRDAAGISRVGMFEQVTTPDGSVFTPRCGSGPSTTYDVTGPRATGKPLKTSNVRMGPDALTWRGFNEGSLSPCESMQNPPFCDDYAPAPVTSEGTESLNVSNLSRTPVDAPQRPRNPLSSPRPATSRSKSAIATIAPKATGPRGRGY